VRRSTRQVLVVVVVVAVVGIAVGVFWPRGDDEKRDANAPIDANAPAARKGTGPAGSRPVTATAPTRPSHSERTGEKLFSLDKAAAAAAYRRGGDLIRAGRLGEGRAEMSKALLSGALPAQQEAAARKTLTDLAEKMLFSPKVYDGDPYTFQYTFQPKEVIAKVERKLKLHVPTQILLKINGIHDARSIRAGQTLKMIRGPFHAIVAKSSFTMDLYLYRQGSDPVFVKRMAVGVGKDGSTPAGLWEVALGKKLVRAPWNPPPNSTEKRSIQWGQPGYPLGKMGYWISLAGIEPRTEMHVGYGIHGTNDPTSIGRAKSLGCIRLVEENIELVFSLLYEKWSTVRVLP